MLYRIPHSCCETFSITTFLPSYYPTPVWDFLNHHFLTIILPHSCCETFSITTFLPSYYPTPVVRLSQSPLSYHHTTPLLLWNFLNHHFLTIILPHSCCETFSITTFLPSYYPTPVVRLSQSPLSYHHTTPLLLWDFLNHHFLTIILPQWWLRKSHNRSGVVWW